MSSQDKYGVTFLTSEKKVIIETPQYLSSYVVSKSCESIVGGHSEMDSAFYPCRNNIKNISFEEESDFSSIDSYVFSKTSLETINFSNCNKLLDINSYCFQYCASLKSIVLPPNLETIGTWAFSSTSIKSISFPKSLKKVENSAFRYSSIITINIPEDTNMEKIGVEAFATTRSLTSFYIGEHVTSIETGAFHTSLIDNFTIHPNNKKYKLSNNCIVEDEEVIKTPVLTFNGTLEISNQIKRIECFRGAKCTNVIIPASVTTIDQWCFSESCLESIVWPKNIESIPYSCFYGCKNLKNITIPEGVLTIETRAFYSCTSLKYIEIPASLVNIKSGAFAKCNIVVNTEKNQNIEIIDEMLFSDSKTTLIEYYGSNTSLTLPSFCKIVGASVFTSKTVESVIFESTTSLELKEYSFQNSNIVKIVFPSCPLIINQNCFDGCSKLTTVVFNSANLSSIASFAFLNCKGLVDIELPSSLDTIGESTFQQCSSLTYLKIPESVKYIGPLCFKDSGIEEIEITSPEVCIKYSAFTNCKVKTLTITSQTFTKVPMEMCYNCDQLITLSLPDSVCEIENEAFALCTSLYSVMLPNNIEVLSTRAFYGCSSLTSVTFPKDSKIQEFKEQVFGNCMKLKTIVIDPGDTKLYFDQCTLMNKNKTEILLYLPSSKNNVFITPESVERILAFSFCNCNSLKNVVIPEGKMTYIGISAFKECKKLSFLNLPSCISTISIDAFKGCISLKCGSVNAPLSIHEQARSAGIPDVAFQKLCSKESCLIRRPKSISSAAVVFLTFIVTYSI